MTRCEIVISFGAQGKRLGQELSVFDFIVTRSAKFFVDGNGWTFVELDANTGSQDSRKENQRALEILVRKLNEKFGVNPDVGFENLVKQICEEIDERFNPRAVFMPNACPPLFSSRVTPPDRCTHCLIMLSDTLADPWWRPWAE
ncbi:TPA: hypothetical protein DF272_05420 [Candidatus Falkowbacteria bacterium]|nr:hypothetical protein [Candidatus Falkowbacteria bacterium]